MKYVILDLRGSEEREALHTLLKEKLDLPDYYGRNLDALHDCLGEICRPTCISIWEQESSDYIAAMKRVFRDSARENPNLFVYCRTI